VTGAVNRVVATAGQGLTASDQVNFDIFGSPGLHLKVDILEQPVFVGKTAKYHLTLTNTGDAPATQIEIKTTMPDSLLPLEKGIKGPTAATIKGQVVTFGRIESLAKGQTAEFDLEATALPPAGDVRVRVEMRSTSLANPQPVIEEQATRIVEAAP
jgi:uncharacterized repeat protein (TIGR01451 family)